MNLPAIADLQSHQAEIMAEVQRELAKHSDERLQELLDAHLQTPALVLMLALSSPAKLCTMAAIPLHMEQLRRAEVRAMEET